MTSQISRPPLTLTAALAPVIAMVVLYVAGAATMGSSAELLIVVLLGAAAVAGYVAVRQGHSWDDIQRASIWLQGFPLRDGLTSVVTGFRLDMLGSVGVDPASVSADLRTLVQRGGLYGMAPTLIVVISAFLLAGAMDVSGSLTLLIHRLLRSVNSVFGLIASTMAAGATMVGLTSHGGVTALVVGGLFQKAYRERGLAPENLSRTLEDSITITEPLMPWTVSGVFMATTVGVPTLQYAPWAVFCYGGPCFSLLLAALYRRTGFGLRTLNPEP